MRSSPSRRWRLAAGSGLAACLAGCQPGPLEGGTGAAMRHSLARMVRQELREPMAFGDRQVTEREGSTQQFVEELGLERWMEELRQMAGPEAYDYAFETLPMGEDLLGQRHRVVGVTLQDAIRQAMENNLEVQFARLAPAVSQAQVVEAEANFDWVFFTNIEYRSIDQPIVDRTAGSQGLGGDFRQSDEATWNIGVRRLLTSGGQLTVQEQLGYADTAERGLQLSPNPSYSSTLTLQVDQPLLRNFGSAVALSQVRIARNAERASIASLKRDLNETLAQTERTYWRLVRAMYDVRILARSVDRGDETYQYIIGRTQLDATSAQALNALSRVKSRQAELERAVNILKTTSDQLKVLINHPDYPVSGELLLLPVEGPMDAPLEFSLADAIATALEHRPEIEQAILSIDDTTIRQLVADNARLPQLDLRAQARLNALEDDFGDALGTTADRDFVDFVVGLFFEVPIGNRGAEALYRRRVRERQQAVTSFQNTVQQVINELKLSLNNLRTFYRLIERERMARISNAETLRGLINQRLLTRGYTVPQLEAELNQQERLAASERQEVQAIIDYNISIADLHRAMGTTLERNNIEFVVPPAPAFEPTLSETFTPASEATGR